MTVRTGCKVADIHAHTFPVTSSFWVTAERTYYWTKLNIDTLELVFHAHILTTLVDKSTVPSGSNGHTGGESTVEVGCVVVSDV